ncbi:unnamed protein product, partial [Rotaria socialis]
TTTSDYIPLILGLSLGLGLPLLIIIGVLISCCLCRDAAHALSVWDENPEPLSLDNSKNDDQDASFDLGPMATTIISFVSPSTNSLTTEGAVERVALPLFPPTLTQQHKSVLLKAYFKQRQQSEG